MGLLGSNVIGNLITPKLKAPKFQPIDIAAEQRKAVKGNVRAFPLIEELSNLAQQLGTQQARQDVEAGFDIVMPEGGLDRVRGLLGDASRGRLPTDVSEMISRRGAEMGITSGTAGSQFNRNLTLRDLALTSLQRTDMALDAITRWAATATSRIPQFNPAAMFITPAQAIAQANIDREGKFNRDFMANQLKVEQSLGKAFATEFAEFDQFVTGLAQQAAGIAIGGAMGGGVGALGGMMGGGGGGGGAPTPPPTPPGGSFQSQFSSVFG